MGNIVRTESSSSKIATRVFVPLAIFYALTSLLDEWQSDHWAIRLLDHPRAHLMWFAGAILLGLIFFHRRIRHSYAYMFMILAGMGLDARRILPYTPVWKIDSVVDSQAPGVDVKFMTANVLQFNLEFGRLLQQIREHDPDVIFLTETHRAWTNAMAELKSRYPHEIIEPLDNTYGLAFYSKFPVRELKVQYLIEKDVPSIHGYLQVPGGVEVELYGLHPRPPVPEVGDSTERDGELLLVAKEIRKSKYPALVIGDLNDVAWSHTTRLFQRVSGLKDPRIGRGQFATYPADLPYLRFPIDHIFHSSSLVLQKLEVLGKNGSDHLPLFAIFRVAKAGDSKEQPIDSDDRKETIESIQRAHEDERKDDVNGKPFGNPAPPNR